MNFSKINAYRARAANCSHQSDLIDDSRLKKYWDDLADDWLALADVLVEKDQYRKVMH
jgi:hypothetical protein